MEGAGSRLGRASSRYGPISSSSIFTGPVRKWKRKWVLSETTTTTANNHRDGGGATVKPSLLLPRWTPLSSETVNEPKRKFRYTPVVELKQKKSEANKEADVESKAGEVTPSIEGDTLNTKDVFGKLNVDDGLMREVQEMTVAMSPSTKKNRVMDLFGKSHSENSNSRDDSF